MGKNEKTPITINDKEYMVEDLTIEQQTMLNHIQDLDRKLANAHFNVDQLNVGRNAFVQLLADSVEAVEDAEVVDEEAA